MLLPVVFDEVLKRRSLFSLRLCQPALARVKSIEYKAKTEMRETTENPDQTGKLFTKDEISPKT